MVVGSAHFYFIRSSVLLHCLWLTLQSVNIRLWLLTIFFLVLWLINLLLHLFFRAIDEVFYGNYRKVTIKEPVFIIANPRSGTTLLHRLIASDGNRFAYMKFAHTLFCSVSFIRLYNTISSIDTAIGNPVKKLLHVVERRLFKGWDGVHNMGFRQAEEDEALFAQMMQSSGIFVLFPFLHRIKNTHCLDKEQVAVRKKAMDFYESSLKRFMYATGSNKIYLAKNVNSSGRIQSLLERFPDARLIFIARNPIDAVPSTASMFSAMYPLHSPRLKQTDAAYREWCELSMEFYMHYTQVRQQFASKRIVALRYSDLLAHPVEEVEKIYSHFGWTFSDELRAKLHTETNKRRSYKSAHSYSLAQYGYTEVEVRERLAPVISEFGF